MKSGVDQMKMIFNLCDHNKEGFIYAEDFKKIGQDHFEVKNMLKLNYLLAGMLVKCVWTLLPSLSDSGCSGPMILVQLLQTL